MARLRRYSLRRGATGHSLAAGALGGHEQERAETAHHELRHDDRRAEARAPEAAQFQGWVGAVRSAI
jgi:hypothetical protein